MTESLQFQKLTERLRKYESLVHEIATDFVEDNADSQRDSWHRKCINLVKEDIDVRYEE